MIEKLWPVMTQIRIRIRRRDLALPRKKQHRHLPSWGTSNPAVDEPTLLGGLCLGVLGFQDKAAGLRQRGTAEGRC